MIRLALHTLKSSTGSWRQRRRVGRGNASRGTYSGRGAKGQRSRTGGRRGLIRRSLRALMERVPKQRGFRSLHPKYAIVNLALLEKRFQDGEVVTPIVLEAKRLVSSRLGGVKILGRGSISRQLTVRAHAFSAAAKAAIEKAGGTAVVLAPPRPVVKPEEKA